MLKLTLVVLILSIACIAQTNNSNFLQFNARIGFDDKKERIVAKRFSEDGTKLMLIGLKSIQIWDVPTAKLIKSYPHEIVELDKFFGTTYLFSPDGSKVIALDSIGRDGDKKADRVNGYVFDVQTGKRIAVLERPETSVRFAFWSANGETLVTFSGLYLQKQTEISFWNAADLSFRNSINVSGYTWHYLTRDGERLYVGNGGTDTYLGLSGGTDEGEVIDVYNTRTAAIEKEFNAGGAEFGIDNYYTHVSPDEKFIATSKDKNIIVWELAGKSLPKYEIAPREAKSEIRVEGFSADGKYLLARQKKIDEFYDAATGQLVTDVAPILKLRRESEYLVPNHLGFLSIFNPYRKEDPILQTPDGEYAVARDCGQAAVHNLTANKLLYTIKGKCVTDGDSIIDTTFGTSNSNNTYYSRDVFRLSPNGKLLVNFRSDEFVVRDLKTGTVLQTVSRKQDKNLAEVPKWNLDWDIRGRYALTIAEDKKSMLIWEINEN
jgi:WD40 repeat protein